jgi:peptidoglycan hydrolase-like protein with peptidoglycan-binding domain
MTTLRPPLLARSVLVSLLVTAGAGCAHTHATPPPPSAVAPTKPDHEQAAETGIPVASTPQGLMKEGAEKRIQQRLETKGLLTAEQVNGQLDPPTRDALRKFQKKSGLPPTGLPSYETVRSLGLDLDAVFHTVAHPKEPAPRSSASKP